MKKQHNTTTICHLIITIELNEHLCVAVSTKTEHYRPHSYCRDLVISAFIMLHQFLLLDPRGGVELMHHCSLYKSHWIRVFSELVQR